MTAFSLTAPAAEPRLPVAQHNLRLLKTVPGLASRYADHDKLLTLDDVAAVPPLAKDDLNVALAHLEPKARQGATWLFQSGGSTGAPKVGYAPTGFYMQGVWDHWKALDRDDVFVNAWGAGRMWGAHFLAGAYADHAGSQVIALGSVTADEYADWLSFFHTRQVTALGGTPSVLRLWFANARAAGLELPHLRKVLWLGEAWHSALDDDIAAVAPHAQRWGMFGSTETWVVGTNSPQCPPDCFHTLPEQLVHVGGDELLDFTTLNPDMLNPVLRYQTGDAGELVDCPCGGGQVMRVLGRRDSVVQVRGLGLHVDDIIAAAERQPGVSRAQIVITEQRGRAAAVTLLVLAGGDFDTDAAGRLRQELLSSTFTLSTAFLHDPQSFQVRITDSLIANDRTGKTANFVQREQQ
ncbi:AMP-binding protein [Catellatospora methionotrophica]|uniref:AMP-binding protein n=1 Tax=Catellatospora methionotrophica TaxID=121620 RepID=UPI0033F8C130